MFEKGKLSPLPQTSQEILSLFPNHDRFTYSLLTGTGNPDLARKVGELLNNTYTYYDPVTREVKTDTVMQACQVWPDGESRIQIPLPVRRKEVIIFNSRSDHPNDQIIETGLIINAAKLADAGIVSAAMPYFSYARQDRKAEPRTPNSSSFHARMLIWAGAKRLLTTDLHSEQTTGAVDEPFDIIYGSRVLLPRVRDLNLPNPVFLAPDNGSTRRNRKHAEILRVDRPTGYIDKERTSEGKTIAHALVGNVSGLDVIISDDEIASGGTNKKAALAAWDNGATSVTVIATHAKFTPDENGRTFLDDLSEPNCPIGRVLVTDTIYQAPNVREHPKVEVLTIAPAYAIALMCWLTGESIKDHLEL